MDQIIGFVERITYVSDEGFTVAKLKQENSKDLLIIVGSMPSIQVGESIKCMGRFIQHKKFGLQFEVSEYEVTAPSDVLGIQKYLESGLIKGVGKVYAKIIIEAFGKDTLEIIDKEPEKLLKLSGFGKKRVEKIKECFDAQRAIRDLIIFLKSFDISPSFASKIYKTYQDDSIVKIKKNPYQLAKDIFGIGFKSADNIAIKLGFLKDSEIRIEAGIEHVLWELTNSGHTCFPKEDFLPEAKKILDVLEKNIEEILEKLILQKRVILKVLEGKEFIFLKSLYFYEQNISKRLFEIFNYKSNIRDVLLDKALFWVQKKLKIKLAKEQIEAVEKALLGKIQIITGGPGTGKSTITNAILSILEKVTNKILLAAPTGRAAKRLSQITRKKAHTIHSLLEFDFQKRGFKKNLQNQLSCNLLIIDEASMIDTILMYNLLLAIPNTCRVIFVGDIDQLPSVGPGNVLKDLIFSKKFSVTILKQIFRQSKFSHIITNAHKINKGEFPYLSCEKKTDFLFFEDNDVEGIEKKILKLVKTVLPKTHKLHSTNEIQVLSPMNRGIIGTQNLNLSLQKALNPSKEPLFRMGKCFHVNDKIMQIKNNYDKDVYNGDIGKIIQINVFEQEMVVGFEERLVTYDFSELDELVLAYAVSVHKYQGSEYPCVIIPIHTSHFVLLFRNLLYTAVTRGKKLVVLVGSKQAIAMAVKNNKILKRYTGLKQSIIQEQQVIFS